MTGSASAVTVSALILRAMSAGVRIGRNNPKNDETSKPGTPASSTVGTSNAAGLRLALEIASPRSWPDLIRSSATPLANWRSMRPAMRSL